jgi:hypothetical protein
LTIAAGLQHHRGQRQGRSFLAATARPQDGHGKIRTQDSRTEVNDSLAGTGVRHARIAFLYLSEPHQIFHSLAPALQLAQRFGETVDILYVSALAAQIVRQHDPQQMLHLVRLRTPLPPLSSGIIATPPRLPTLLANLFKLARYDYLVTTERTSTLLRLIPGIATKLIHIPHGAGDRAQGYDPRIRHFDLILAAGAKDRRRFIDRGLATEKNCVVAGYSKPELMDHRDRPFPGDRPLVLYNPHFQAGLSSWIGHQDAMLRVIANMPDMDFVLAPHVRMKPRHRVADPGLPNLLIDWGSVRSMDMSYTSSADLYLGDVSSQVYEFIARPRPCIFLNPARVDWQDNPHYAHWRFGEVVDKVADLPEALRAASARHISFAEAQRSGMADSIDQSDIPASLRQAEAIRQFMGAVAETRTRRL